MLPKTKKKKDDGEKKSTKTGVVKSLLKKATGNKEEEKKKKETTGTGKTTTKSSSVKPTSTDKATTTKSKTTAGAKKEVEKSASSVPNNMGSSTNEKKPRRLSTQSPSPVPPKGKTAQRRGSASEVVGSKPAKEDSAAKTKRGVTPPPTLNRGVTPPVGPKATGKKSSTPKAEKSGTKMKLTDRLKKAITPRKADKVERPSSRGRSTTPSVGRSPNSATSKTSESPVSVNKARRSSTSALSSATSPSVSSTRKTKKDRPPSVASTRSVDQGSEVPSEDVGSQLDVESEALDASVDPEAESVVDSCSIAVASPVAVEETAPSIVPHLQDDDDARSIVAPEDKQAISRSSSRGPQPVRSDASEMQPPTKMSTRSSSATPRDSASFDGNASSRRESPDSAAVLEKQDAVESKAEECSDLREDVSTEAKDQQFHSEIEKVTEQATTTEQIHSEQQVSLAENISTDTTPAIQTVEEKEKEEIKVDGESEAISSPTKASTALNLDLQGMEAKDSDSSKTDVSRINVSPSPLTGVTPREDGAKSGAGFRQTLFTGILGEVGFAARCPSEEGGPSVDSEELKQAIDDLDGFSELDTGPLTTELPETSPVIPAPQPDVVVAEENRAQTPPNLALSDITTPENQSPLGSARSVSISSDLSSLPEEYTTMQKYEATNLSPRPADDQQAPQVASNPGCSSQLEKTEEIDAKKEQPKTAGGDRKDDVAEEEIPDNISELTDPNAPSVEKYVKNDDLLLLEPKATKDETTLPVETEIAENPSLANEEPAAVPEAEKKKEEEPSLTEEALTGNAYSSKSGLSSPDPLNEYRFYENTDVALAKRFQSAREVPPQSTATGRNVADTESPSLGVDPNVVETTAPAAVEDVSEETSTVESNGSSGEVFIGSDDSPTDLEPSPSWDASFSNPNNYKTPTPVTQSLPPAKMSAGPVGLGKGMGLPQNPNKLIRPKSSKSVEESFGKDALSFRPKEKSQSSITNSISEKGPVEIEHPKRSSFDVSKSVSKDPVDPPLNEPPKSRSSSQPGSSKRTNNEDPKDKGKSKGGRRFLVTWAVSVLGVAVTVFLFRKRGGM